MKRSDDVDQSATLAERLGMERVFAGTMERDGGTYGIALLSRLPFVKVERFDLPEGGFESRTAIDAQVCAGDQPVRVVSTHADFTPWAAGKHAQAIADHIEGAPDVVVMGDMNVTPDSDAMKPLLADPMQDALGMFDEGPTFGDKDRIDYILTDNEVTGAQIVDSDASDHRPVLATVDVPEP
jgi:endonuclease/exonuclease/phosphatase family metal-dependent hydrolase